MKLSILIPTVPQREAELGNLLRELHRQIEADMLWNKVEILFDDDKLHRLGGKTTGEKRNDLLQRSRGEFVWFIDDDDTITNGALNKVIEGITDDVDVISFNGYWIENGERKVPFEIRLNNPYIADYRDGQEWYLRYPNHIAPMRRTIANQFRFPLTCNFEDKAFADAVKDAGALKKEYVINEFIYLYQYSSFDKLY